MDRLGGEEIGRDSAIKTVAGASLIGTSIEWYDFYLYATAAALVFPALFFPEFSETAGILAAFATYGAGFVVRPLGGAFFGHYGDKIGRKSMLVATLLLMGVATFLVGVLPTYAQVGVLAPLLLVVLRLLQGFSAGGEWGGAVLMIVEHSPNDRRGFYGSFPQMGIPVGLIVSTLALLLLSSSLSEEAFLTWGWRVPFLFSILLVGVGLFIRLRVMESPAFTRVKETHTEARLPIVDVFRTHWRQVALAVGSYLVTSVTFTVSASFVLSYGTTTVGFDQSTVLTALLIASALELIIIPIGGALSDRVGRKPVYLVTAVGSILWAFPLFWLVDTGRFIPFLLGITISIVILGLGYGAVSSFYAEMFGTRVRYSGASTAYQIGVIGGAFAPFAATALLASTGGSWSISASLMLVAVVSTVCTLLIRETLGTDLYEVRPEEQQLVAEAGSQGR